LPKAGKLKTENGLKAGEIMSITITSVITKLKIAAQFFSTNLTKKLPIFYK
jgi:hypothetical protein